MACFHTHTRAYTNPKAAPFKLKTQHTPGKYRNAYYPVYFSACFPSIKIPCLSPSPFPQPLKLQSGVWKGKPLEDVARVSVYATHMQSIVFSYERP